MKRILKVNAVLAFIIVITACNFFTTSWGSGLKRDNADKLAQLTVDDLAVLLTDPDYTSDPESIASLLDALGEKTPEEIQGLSVEDKQAILELTISAGVPISSLAGIMEQATSGDPGSALSELLSSTDVINVDAAAAVLTDPEMLETADTTVLTAAAVTVLVQVVAAETGDAEDQDAAVTELVNDITDTIADSPADSTAEDIVDQMIADGAISEESREEMIAVTTAMQVLSGTSTTGVDRSGGDSPLGGLLP
ncbi:MAG TPA: hypothetical protein PLU33_09510 [Treponemataceae bacterium]|nr:hypothetical protein [Treponemataceae bacterium]